MRQIRRLTNEIRHSINLDEFARQGQSDFGTEGMPPFAPSVQHTPPPTVEIVNPVPPTTHSSTPTMEKPLPLASGVSIDKNPSA
ncbi:MAG: hypothetical protein HQL62_08885 [Magnetococcales bacterium]|nr:hypothetical protein [Magnetococcales bacterium]